MIEEISLDKVEELFERFIPWKEEFQKMYGFIFRGHSKEEYQLIPSALRESNKEYFWGIYPWGKPIDNQCEMQSWQITNEYNLLRDFYKRADKEGLSVPKSDYLRENLSANFDIHNTHRTKKEIWLNKDLLEVAGLAQHYGIPTRLLDWTCDPYISFYFAFSSAINAEEGNLVIWALNKEHICFLDKTTESTGVKFITPHYGENPNLKAQQGLFSHMPTERLTSLEESNLFFEGKYIPVNRMTLDDLLKSKMKKSDVVLLRKYILPRSEAKKGMKILMEMGYDDRKIFPGYKGIADSILKAHKYLK